MPIERDLSQSGRPARHDPGVPAAGRAAAAARTDAAQHLRAALSRDDRRRAALGPSPDRHDPARPAHPGSEDKPNLYKVGCVGRLTQIAESGDGRYLIQLTGIARFRIEEELDVATPYRQCRVSFAPFTDDFNARKGEDEVDRESLLKALKDFLEANNLKADWEGIENAPNEALVNALAMMSPYGAGREAGAAGGARPEDPRRNPGRGHRDRARQEDHRRRRPPLQ